jgi:PhnB protein
MHLTYPALIPSLAVHDGARAIEFYKTGLGATERYRLTDPASGKVGHAELMINGALVMLADEFAPYNRSPQTLGGVATKLCLIVDDVDAATERARVAGATVIAPPTDQFYGHRSASVRDPFGHEWMFQREIEIVPPAEMQRRWDAMPKNG